jgi:hypothetical protein
MAKPKTESRYADNIYTRMSVFEKAGDETGSATYVYDRVILVTHGTVTVEYGDKTTTAHSPSIVITPSGVVQKITALEDDSIIFSIHAVRNGQNANDVVDPEITAEEARQLIMDNFPVSDRNPEPPIPSPEPAQPA